MDRLPIIDIAPLYGADRGAWNDVARRIDQACREWGFFYIAGHPLPAARFEALLAAARESLRAARRREAEDRYHP